MPRPHDLIRWWGVLRLALLLGLPMVLAAPPARADACGAAGQRACNIDERIPSCDVNLVEAGGTCVRPNCGAEGQRLCSVIQRTTFNWILMTPLPVPQPCDINLRDVGGLCKQPTDCGREGQAECGAFVRIPSCDLNLVASGGRCTHPPLCGRVGQQPCPITMRGPARMCDANLVARLGQCMAAGTAETPVAAGPATTTPDPDGRRPAAAATPAETGAPCTGRHGGARLDGDGRYRRDRSGHGSHGWRHLRLRPHASRPGDVPGELCLQRPVCGLDLREARHQGPGAALLPEGHGGRADAQHLLRLGCQGRRQAVVAAAAVNTVPSCDPCPASPAARAAPNPGARS